VNLFDSHAHIAAPELRAEAVDLLSRARDAGLRGLIAVGAGYGLDPNESAIELAQQHDDVWATVGLHPHDASAWSDDAEQRIEAWLGRPRVVAVGECGIDYWYEHSPRDEQRECLRAQIRIARRHTLPLVIHVRASRGSRDAFEEIVTIFDDEGAEKVGGVIHCFTGDKPFADECLARGFDVSFSGILTFRNSDALRDVATRLPLDRLLVETDTPLLAPVPYRGRRNEPAYVHEVVTCLAELHGETAEVVAEKTAERAHTRFRLEGEVA
jgi:TatD DNase family protein